MLPAVRVNRKATDRAKAGHPWIFRGYIVDAGAAQGGDAVRVIDFKGRFLGTAHYSSTSEISLRLLSSRLETVNEHFLNKRVEAAYAYRRRMVSNSDAFRLVHAEADLLPGLIVDRYADWLVVQLLDQGMDRLAHEITNVLSKLLNPKGIVARNDPSNRTKENLPREVRVLAGEVPQRVEIRMNGLNLEVDLLAGQKTGIFLDQRENYLAARQYAHGRILDCFCGTGGFALHVASSCEFVEAIDSSAAALSVAKTNAAANKITNLSFVEANVFDYLPSLVAARRTYDLVILDPPAFTKSRASVHGAARGYREVNLRALRLLSRGGILLTCSCSHHMSEAQLLGIIAAAALDCGKQLRVLERRTQARDHPILLTVPETHYLKCLLFEVM